MSISRFDLAPGRRRCATGPWSRRATCRHQLVRPWPSSAISRPGSVGPRSQWSAPALDGFGPGPDRSAWQAPWRHTGRRHDAPHLPSAHVV